MKMGELKWGGTSVGTVERVKKVAKSTASHKKKK